MTIRHLAVFGTVLAAGIGAAALLGCTSVNPAPDQPPIDPLPAEKNPWLQKSGLCEGVKTDNLPGIAQWIDDFEDRGNKLSKSVSWAPYSDEKFDDTGDSQVLLDSGGDPVELPETYGNGSENALHLKAYFPNPDKIIVDADHWGANWQYETVGGGRAAPATGRDSFDFSPYAGMVMWVRRGSTDASSSFTVQFPTPWTLDVPSGGDGSCVDDKADPGTDAGSGVNGKCYAHMTYQGSAIDCWRPIKIYFTGPNFNLAPVFNPGPNAFDAKHVYGLEISFSSSTAGSVAKYWPVDMWVDDVYLFKAEDDK